MDWLDLLAVQGTLKSLIQNHNSKWSLLQCSAFFMVQLSHPYMTAGKTIASIIYTFVGKVMSLLFNACLGTKKLCDEIEGGEWKVGLKVNIQKTKIMASGPNTSWQMHGDTVETVSDLILGGSKITVAMKLKDACSLEGKLWPTQTAYSKAETLLCRLRSVKSRLWFFQ